MPDSGTREVSGSQIERSDKPLGQKLYLLDAAEHSILIYLLSFLSKLNFILYFPIKRPANFLTANLTTN